MFFVGEAGLTTKEGNGILCVKTEMSGGSEYLKYCLGRRKV